MASFQWLHSHLTRWTKPLNTSLVLGTVTDLFRSKSQLVAENALLRQQLLILHRQVKRPRWVLPWEMVENSTSPCERLSGRFFVMRQSRQAFSSQSEAPSELFCGYLHPSPRDMIQHPILLRCLSSGNLWQWAREHLTCRPSPGGSAGCHGWCSLPVALRQKSAPSL